MTAPIDRVADGTGVIAPSTKTALGKGRQNGYTEHLINDGFAWPAGEPPPRL